MNIINYDHQVTWQCPSNLAIVKYWGKHGRQLPRNASMSLTLQEAKTITTLSWLPKKNNDSFMSLDFTFEGLKNENFQIKIQRFLESVSKDYFPFLTDYHLTIESKNTFPHSSGIASSASSMGALALCLCSMEKKLISPEMSEIAFNKKASFIARLGSGSASRSVIGYWALWGVHPQISHSSDEYAVDITKEVHPVFKTIKNDIFIVSAGEKSVSSTAGHQLMENNPFANARYIQANQRILKLRTALQLGHLVGFGEIAEAEALTLHALMMCSEPSYTLFEPNSLEMIKRIKYFRAKTKLPVCFSLDAGPNIHFLYPEEIGHRIQDFLDNDLQPLCQDQLVIRDSIGAGPKMIFHHEL